MIKRENIRNIAIIAHVDHGKTTLVDAMLAQSGSVTIGNVDSRFTSANALPTSSMHSARIMVRVREMCFIGLPPSIFDSRSIP